MLSAAYPRSKPLNITRHYAHAILPRSGFVHVSGSGLSIS
jgi:hypothetical protein